MVVTNLPLPKEGPVITIENLIIYADLLPEKVFYNLIENALRHGKGVFRITFSSQTQKDQIIIVCQESGNGIPEAYKEGIFNRQYFENTGFGLFLLREILGITSLSIQRDWRTG
jgi:K+-sensing histidine kinase KdpD